MPLAELLAASMTPTPGPTTEFDETLVTPGPLGFVFIFVLAVAALLLILDMTRRVRRVRYREEIRAEIADEQLGADAATDDDINERPLNDDRPERGDTDRR
ncbi:hypothetical protein [Herbiconiux sp. L3-i23]|uniref:hypothetical protein n=1 Tax=Herbiconiux sp. L3-i23 TaxID=2905871 RepID=UPI0020491F5F|nr:hypothetical protein [Herbiconiux sp. L3-i23]BDI23570.1 hypothetical protein L3i23_23460 [Herbiconiux sp. L3-i23]